MSRCFVVVDPAPGADLAGLLRSGCAALVAGGSAERVLEIVRPPFAAAVLTLGEAGPIVETHEEVSIDLAPGAGAVPGAGIERPADVRSDRAAPGGAPPAGRRAILVWSKVSRVLRIETEANGQLPLFHALHGDRLLVASEAKAIFAVAGSAPELDPDGLLELHALGHLLGERTLYRGVRWALPGAVLRFGPDGLDRGRAGPLRFEDARGGDIARLAVVLDGVLDAVMLAYRGATPRMTVALSGGLDSRTLLAAARPHWSDLDAITFGEDGSADVELACEVAQRAGVPHHAQAPARSFLADWAGYAVWRSDGMLSCLHAQGMDAVLAAAPRSRHLLNGMGGDLLMGAFLRPSHLTRAGDPARAARAILDRTRPTHAPLEQIFKPEVLARATTRPEATLVELLRAEAHERLGNLLLGYWLRYRCGRLTSLGVGLESPFVQYWTPFVEPGFVREAARLPLEARFMNTVQRRVLARRAPELARIRWERLGLAPRWPWPVLALSKLGRRAGLVPRPRPAVDHAAALRTTLRSWTEALLLDRATLEDGWFRPDYLRSMVSDHLAGRLDRTSEIGLALTIELGRRIFMERDAARAAPPESGAFAGGSPRG